MVLQLGAISAAFWVFLTIMFLNVVAIFLLLIFVVPTKLWFKCLVNNAHLSMIKLSTLKKQKNVNLELITTTYISLKKAGFYVNIDEIVTHQLIGGNIENVASALIWADSAGVDLSVDLAKAIDLSGENVVNVVKSTISPVVIESDTITALAQDGIEVKIKFKLTMSPILTKIVGGTKDDTIMAKLSEGVVAIVGTFANHKEAISNPDIISKALLAKDLAKNSAYKIHSIDISSITIGRNVWALLRMDEIEIDKRLATAKAEEARMQGYIEEQQLKVKAQQMQNEKLAKEAEIPKAIADAFREGKVSAMDYYKLQNIIADTNMRRAIADNSSKS